MNVKLNDNVVVITGKYAGRRGKVVSTSPKTGKVTVAGVNIQHKAKKARRSNEVSEIREQEGPIDVSNVMVLCDACDKPVRVKSGTVDGKRVRVCPKCGAVLDKAYGGKKSAKEAKNKEEPKKRVRKRAAKAEEAKAKAKDVKVEEAKAEE